jgi:hypothetical protein
MASILDQINNVAKLPDEKINTYIGRIHRLTNQLDELGNKTNKSFLKY